MAAEVSQLVRMVPNRTWLDDMFTIPGSTIGSNPVKIVSNRFEPVRDQPYDHLLPAHKITGRHKLRGKQ